MNSSTKNIIFVGTLGNLANFTDDIDEFKEKYTFLDIDNLAEDLNNLCKKAIMGEIRLEGIMPLHEKWNPLTFSIKIAMTYWEDYK